MSMRWNFFGSYKVSIESYNIITWYEVFLCDLMIDVNYIS